VEVQTLQANQKRDIEELYLRMGKVPPPGIVSVAAMLNHRQRRLSRTGSHAPSGRSSLQRPDTPPPAGEEAALHYRLRPHGVGRRSGAAAQDRAGRGVTFAPDDLIQVTAGTGSEHRLLP